MDSFSTVPYLLDVEMEDATQTQDRAHHFFYLPCKRRTVQVNTTTEENAAKITALGDREGLYVSVWPHNVDANSTMNLTASIAVKWMSSDGVNQEVSYVLHHSFIGPNASKWRIRLDGYLPLLEDAKDDNNTAAGLIEVLVERQSMEQPCHSLFSPFPIPSVKVKVEEELFSASKELLAVHSQFFTTLFYGNFKERDQETVQLKEVSSKAFNPLMQVISRSQPDSEEDVCELIVLADQYDMLGVMKRCVKYAESLTLNEDNPCLPTLLLLSDTCRQQELQNHVLQSIKSPTVLYNAFRAVTTEMTRETVDALLHRMTMIAGPIEQYRSKVWMQDPYCGRLHFELFYERTPRIAYVFAQLFTLIFHGQYRASISRINGNTFNVNCAWREDIAGHTPRKENGWLLYTNSMNSFEITQCDKPNGHFFGKLMNLYNFSNTDRGIYSISDLGS